MVRRSWMIRCIAMAFLSSQSTQYMANSFIIVRSRYKSHFYNGDVLVSAHCRQ